MSSKKNTTIPTNLPALKLGSRVRCTDDGVTGRIVWANAVSVKIQWDDGEQVTWKRDALATRPIAILNPEDAAPAEAQPEPPEPAPVPATPEQTAETPPIITEPEPAEPAADPIPAADTPPVAEAGSTEPPMGREATPHAARPEAGDLVEDRKPETPTADSTSSEQAPEAPAPPKRQRKARAEPKEKKVSALDAAARVLAEAGAALTCKQLIGTMAAKGYWSSPGGRTPDATLGSAILREIKVKGERSRFTKAAPGRFASRGAG